MARSALTGTRIRERRLALRLRQADLARSLGISAAYLNLIEHNRRRVSEPLLAAFAEALGVEALALSEGAEGALFEALREAAAGGAGGGTGGGTGAEGGFDHAELERIEEFVGRFPAWARVLAARQGRVAALERVVESYSERMAQDPFLLDSLHEVLSAVTSLRSTAAILVETEDIEPEWRRRFLGTIAEESLRLSGAAEGLVEYLDEMEGTETGLSSPLEQLEAWLDGRGWHVAELERPEAHRAETLRPEMARPEMARPETHSPAVPPPAVSPAAAHPEAPPAASTRFEALIAQAPDLAASATQELARAYLAQAAADARALPLKPFLAALAELGPEPGLLAQRFGLPMAPVFRRLATLPEGLVGVVPMGLVVCDASGTLTLRRPLPGFGLPRFGAACPLWPLYEALSRPMQPIRTVVDMAGRLPQRFLTYAFAAPRAPGGFDDPVLMEAMMLILPAPAAAAGPGSSRAAAPAPRPVGSSCRICPRIGCAGRREPSLVSGR